MPLVPVPKVMEFALARLIQDSMVKSCSCRTVGFPRTTAAPFVPHRKAWPTLPGAKLACPASVPPLVLTASAVELSACHQPTIPGGAGAHAGLVTVKRALELSTPP